jgi:hypothetical protein
MLKLVDRVERMMDSPNAYADQKWSQSGDDQRDESVGTPVFISSEEFGISGSI